MKSSYFWRLILSSYGIIMVLLDFSLSGHVAGIGIAALIVFSITFILVTVVDFLAKHRKLVDVPVLNLEGWAYKKAQDAYNADFTSLIKVGYEKVP